MRKLRQIEELPCAQGHTVPRESDTQNNDYNASIYFLHAETVERALYPKEMANFTVVTGFFLMGFSNSWELEVLHAILFLLIYLVALLGNLLIFTFISLDGKLHTPMYFFLKNLSFLDLCLVSVTVPKSIANSLSNTTTSLFGGVHHSSF